MKANWHQSVCVQVGVFCAYACIYARCHACGLSRDGIKDRSSDAATVSILLEQTVLTVKCPASWSQ